MRRLLALAVCLSLSGCTLNDCCSAEIVHEGITETDAEGTPTGAVDARDWALAAGSDGGPVPDGVAVWPAFPNPAVGEAVVRFSVPSAQRVTARLFTQRDRPQAEILDAEMAAGTHELRIPAPPDPGLYRLVIEGEGWSSQGDLQFGR